MGEQKEQNIKYSTYLPPDVIAAIKRLAVQKRVPANFVIESAIRKVMPERYFKDPYQKE